MLFTVRLLHLAHGQTCNLPEVWRALLSTPPVGIVRVGKAAYGSVYETAYELFGRSPSLSLC